MGNDGFFMFWALAWLLYTGSGTLLLGRGLAWRFPRGTMMAFVAFGCVAPVLVGTGVQHTLQGPQNEVGTLVSGGIALVGASLVSALLAASAARSIVLIVLAPLGAVVGVAQGVLFVFRMPELEFIGLSLELVWLVVMLAPIVWWSRREARAYPRACVCGYSFEGLKLRSVCPECGRREGWRVDWHRMDWETNSGLIFSGVALLALAVLFLLSMLIVLVWALLNA